MPVFLVILYFTFLNNVVSVFNTVAEENEEECQVFEINYIRFLR